MSQEAMTLALDALEHHTAIKHPQQSEHVDKAINALRAALDAPGTEPVGWFGYSPAHDAWFHTNEGEDDSIPLYRRPQPDYERGFIDGMQEQMKRSVDQAVRAMSGKHEWQGLTAKDLAEIPPSCFEGAIWADAKLKEKNGG